MASPISSSGSDDIGKLNQLQKKASVEGDLGWHAEGEKLESGMLFSSIESANSVAQGLLQTLGLGPKSSEVIYVKEASASSADATKVQYRVFVDRQKFGPSFDAFQKRQGAAKRMEDSVVGKEKPTIALPSKHESFPKELMGRLDVLKAEIEKIKKNPPLDTKRLLEICSKLQELQEPLKKHVFDNPSLKDPLKNPLFKDSAKEIRDPIKEIDDLVRSISSTVFKDQARNIEVLDLATRNEAKPKTDYERSLEIRPQIHAARIAEEISQDIFNVSIPLFFIPVQKYGDKTITTMNVNAMTCEQVKKMIQQEAIDFRSSTDYNSLHFIQSFLKFFDEQRKSNPYIKEVEAFRKFKPDSSDEAIRMHGSTCVGQSIDFIKTIQTKYNIDGKPLIGHVVVETLSPTAPANHAAAVFPCTDGILLVEILEKEVITIKPSGKTIKLVKIEEGGVVVDSFLESIEILETPGNFSLPKNTMIVKRGEKDGQKMFQSQFILRPANRPDHTIMKRYFLKQPNYPVAGASDKNITHVIKVNIAMNKVTYQIGESDTAKKVSFPLEAFDPETGRIDPKKLNQKQKDELAFLSDDFFKAFRTPRAMLEDQVGIVVAGRKILKNLYDQMGRT